MDYRKQIEGLRKNSYSDFKILYEAFVGPLFGFVYSLTKSGTIAKDIVQETFLRVWKYRKNINPDLSFKSYLFKIAQNLILDGLRKQLNDPVFESYLDYCDKLALSGNAAEQKMDFDIFVKRLEAAKRKLSSRQREIFEMSKEQGIPASEIAQRLALSEQTVYNQLSMAMHVIRQELGPAFYLLFFIFFDSLLGA
jgi:RNA polymerase sigma-70 factor (ECF subfamily)